MPFLGVAGLGGLIAFLKADAKPSSVLGGILSEDSTYFYRTFRGNGTLTVTGGVLAADVLVVAGGGGGGRYGGGGGAGGLQGFSSQTLTPTAHTVAVGSGGAGWLGDTQTGGQAASGTNSYLGTLTASVGGGGAGNYSNTAGTNVNGANGGSGGGAGRTGPNAYGVSKTGGSATLGQGYSGGNGIDNYNNYSGGGGGGAGAVGASAGAGAAGGVGLSTHSSWGLATGTGHNVAGTVYYAGGGASSTYGTTVTAGGNGGGGYGYGAGATYSSSTSFDGGASTGGGGGGSSDVYSGTWRAGNGGSGIVIVRYLKTAVLPSTDAYELIGTITLTSAQSAVTFAGIPASQYKHLQIRYSGRSNRADTDSILGIRLNGATTNYYYHYLYGNGSTAISSSGTNTVIWWYAGLAGATLPSGVTASGVIDVLDPFSVTKNTTIRGVGGITHTSYPRATLNSAAWFSTAAVTSIELSDVFSTMTPGTSFSLYGLRG